MTRDFRHCAVSDGSRQCLERGEEQVGGGGSGRSLSMDRGGNARNRGVEAALTE